MNKGSVEVMISEPHWVEWNLSRRTKIRLKREGNECCWSMTYCKRRKAKEEGSSLYNSFFVVTCLDFRWFFDLVEESRLLWFPVYLYFPELSMKSRYRSRHTPKLSSCWRVHYLSNSRGLIGAFTVYFFLEYLNELPVLALLLTILW
jgi:hypothetical protein